jgi:hypothetical protein
MSAGVSVRKFSLLVLLAACTLWSGSASAQQVGPIAKTQTLPVKDPQLATVIGVLIPGGGQLYASRYGKGLALLLGSAATIGIAVDANRSHCSVANTCNRTAVVTAGIGSAVVLWGFGWVTAANDARRFNAQMLNRTSLVPFLDRRNGQLLAGLALHTR